jgi:hypothetical protein
MERRLHLRPPKKNITLRDSAQSALAERADSTPQRRQSRRDVTTCSPARQCRVGLGLSGESRRDGTMPSSCVSGRVMSDQTEHSRAIIVGYVPSGHYFRLVTISRRGGSDASGMTFSPQFLKPASSSGKERFAPSVQDPAPVRRSSFGCEPSWPR